jgi:CMP-N-acetylneuraminic acid synthetase
MAIRLTKVKKAAIAIMEEALGSLSIRRKRITSMNKQSLITHTYQSTLQTSPRLYRIR